MTWLETRKNLENLPGRSFSAADFGLERVAQLHRRAGSPESKFCTIHVTGTKGKGSTAAMLANALTDAGFRVGLFQSPHVDSLFERIQVDGASISGNEFEKTLEDLRPFIETMDAEERTHPSLGFLTFFEILTVAAFLHFAQKSVDFAVVEVGMGGLHDATNICTPILSILTNISLEHTTQLGGTIEAIAREKGGIIKPGAPVLSGVLQTSAQNVLRELARERNSEFFQMGQDFCTELPANISVGMFGEHQRQNAACVCAAVEILRKLGVQISDFALESALKRTKLPGRLEIVSENPRVILDAAHNEASLRAALTTVDKMFPTHRKRVLFAVSDDKNWQEMLFQLAQFSTIVYPTEYRANSRCVPAAQLEAFLRRFPVRVEKFPERLTLDSDELLLVTGSFFLLREFRQILNPTNPTNPKP